jgi:hypothetical protein
MVEVDVARLSNSLGDESKVDAIKCELLNAIVTSVGNE